MNNKTKLIGVSGKARVGKDSFSNALVKTIQENYPSVTTKRFAFADELKRELAPFFMEQFGVDVFNLPDETKEIYRPMLIAHGQIRRALTKNKYWVDKLQETISREQPDFAVISDLRYIVGENSEFDWIKQNNGLVVHVERYEYERVLKKETHGNEKGKISLRKKFFPPASNDEKENDPRLKKAADYNVSWETSGKEYIEKDAREKSLDFYLKNINFFLK